MVFPVGAVVAVVVIALRAASAASKNKDGTPTPAAAPVPVSRGSSSFAQDTGAAGTLLYQLLLLGGVSAGLGLGVALGNPLAFGPGALALYLLFPAWTGRVVFVPLGLARLAYLSGWLSRVAWRRDKPGGPALLAAWALVHQARPSAASIAWVEGKLTSSKRAVQGSGVVAFGLLEAAKGNLEGARAWLQSVALFDPRVAPTQVRRVAAEWLATDAAATGDWPRVKALTRDRAWPPSATLTLLGALADRLNGEPLPTNAGLTLWWLFAPRRLWSRRFVNEVSARAPQKRAREQGLPSPPQGLDGPARATFLTLALQARPRPTASAVVAVARTWEAALGDDLRAQLHARAQLNGGGEPEDAMHEVRTLLEQALGPLLPAKLEGVSGELPPLVEAAVVARKDALFADLEERMNRMDARKLDQRELPAFEEWREVMTLRRVYLESCALGSEGDRSLAFSILRDKLVNYGAWLYNQRLERPIANAVFRLLEAEAVALGDDESARLNKKNAGCDL